MNKIEISLKDLNIYIAAKKFLDKKHSYLLAKTECFEINGVSPTRFWFKVVTKTGHISNTKKRNKILGEYFLETPPGHFNFTENYINKFRKYKIQKETYTYGVICYIIDSILAISAENYKFLKLKSLSCLRISNKIVDDKMKVKYEKLGLIITSNKHYTYISVKNNAKEILTYLRLSGEISVLTK